jgi:hypothetical protein
MIVTDERKIQGHTEATESGARGQLGGKNPKNPPSEKTVKMRALGR